MGRRQAHNRLVQEMLEEDYLQDGTLEGLAPEGNETYEAEMGEGGGASSRPLNLNAPTVLVLNASYEALHVCSIKRAVTLLMHNIAERIEDGTRLLHSPSTAVPVPSVIRLRKYVKRPPRHHIAFNRRNVFRRDNHTCQYCGHVGGDLTLDHVVPRSKGGRNSWENIVTACRDCNSRKRDRTPEEAKMRLTRQPFAPKFVFTTAYGQAPRVDPLWEKYLG